MTEVRRFVQYRLRTCQPVKIHITFCAETGSVPEKTPAWQIDYDALYHKLASPRAKSAWFRRLPNGKGQNIFL
jgi:hypothetical protein